MADIQKQFEKFHETIRVDYDMSTTLREKRDIVLKKIRTSLREGNRPGFDELLQGSYRMKTGVKPIAELEFDIDIGLRFNFSEKDYSPTEVRKWVYESVSDHTRRIEDKGPCIRVCYEAGYHLDLVSYAVWENPAGEKQFRLAHKANGWRPADPPGLLEYIDRFRERFYDTDDSATKTDQFRRCIRSLRRWNDEQIPREAKEKPTGLALVLLAIQRGLTRATFVDGRSDDRRALEQLVVSLATTVGRLVATKPTPEHEDVLARPSDNQMDAFKKRLEQLGEALEFAGATADPVEACKELRKHFGSDFPVPDPEETGKKTSSPAIVPSSSSA